MNQNTRGMKARVHARFNKPARFHSARVRSLALSLISHLVSIDLAALLSNTRKGFTIKCYTTINVPDRCFANDLLEQSVIYVLNRYRRAIIGK